MYNFLVLNFVKYILFFILCFVCLFGYFGSYVFYICAVVLIKYLSITLLRQHVNTR